MHAASIPIAPPAPPLPLALNQLPPIRYSLVEHIDACSKSRHDKVMVACLGVEWLFMSISYTKQIIALGQQSMHEGKVDFFYIDEEVERDFLESQGFIGMPKTRFAQFRRALIRNHDLVGTPALMFWILGSRVVFQRPGWGLSSVVAGLISETSINTIVSQILEQSTAIGENPRTIIKLNF